MGPCALRWGAALTVGYSCNWLKTLSQGSARQNANAFPGSSYVNQDWRRQGCAFLVRGFRPNGL